MLETLTKESWSECLGGSFELLGDGRGTITMMLAEVTGLGHGASGRRDPYSLVFRGPASPILPQRIYRLRHEHMGDLELFLVPIGPDGEGRRYSPDAGRVAPPGFPVFLLSGEQLARYELSSGGAGIHWEDLNEDISVEGLWVGRGDLTTHRRVAV